MNDNCYLLVPLDPGLSTYIAVTTEPGCVCVAEMKNESITNIWKIHPYTLSRDIHFISLQVKC